MIAQVNREKPFDSIIKEYSYAVAKNFKPSINFLKQRFDVEFISPTKFLQSNQYDLSLADNQILIFYLFAKDEKEQGKVNTTIKKIFEKFPERCIVADFSSTPFTKARYDKFAQNKAKELYFKDEPNQRDQVKLAANEAKSVLDEWNKQLDVANVRVYRSLEESVQLAGERKFLRHLEQLNQYFYPYGLETITNNDKVFEPQRFSQKVAEYALGMDKIVGSYAYLNNIEQTFKSIDGRNNKKYWIDNPSHSISKLKSIVEDVIQSGFEKKSEVRFFDIWNALKKPPIGLMKCSGAFYIFAALLNEYANSVYYVRDINHNTPPLSDGKLANLVFNAVKEICTVNDNFIIKQTPEQVEFCTITAEIFSLTTDKLNFIDDVAKNVNIQLTRKKYPFWAIKYYVEKNFQDSPQYKLFSNFVDLMNEFISPRTVNSRDKKKIADEIYALYYNNSLYIDELKNLVRYDNFRAGMACYIAKYKPEFIQITSKLKIEQTEFLSKLTEKFSADSSYLWKVEDFNSQIEKFYLELRLVDALNLIISEPQKYFYTAQHELSLKLNRIKMPQAIVEEFQPNLKNILQAFDSVTKNSFKDFEQAINQIETFAAQFKTFFDNQFKIFAEFFQQYIDAMLDNNKVNMLYGKIQSGVFFKSTDEFISFINQQLQFLKQGEKTQKFFDTWKSLTGTTSPKDWSKQNEVPILCLFQDCLSDAQLYFTALNKNSQLTAEKIDAGLKFSQSDKLNRLHDKIYCEKYFLNYFGGEYASVLDVDNLKKILCKNLDTDVYSWYSKKFNCETKIKNFAEDNYRKNFVPKVREKVRSLTAEEAQKYLEELIEKDTLLGIRVLKNS